VVRCTAGLACALLAGCAEPQAQASELTTPLFSADSATVRVAAGAHYARRGAWWQRLWGPHYRQLWATPVTVPVLRLGAAGLRPLHAGGSFQTNTLRLRHADGHTYVLRSVDKDLSRSITTGWLEELIGPVLRDQTSAAPPYGAYVAAALAQSAGVYHTHPRMVYLRPDSALGSFRTRFQPALYLLEERPDHDHSTVPLFGGAQSVTGSGQMLHAVLHKPNAHVAARAYLRARLLDMLVGDWSRRADQWRWAMFTQAGHTEYRPIPRDRDQAFFRFDDGWLTRAISWVRPRYQSFDAPLPPMGVAALTITARPLDQTILGLLPEADFQAEADSLCRRLPDAVLAAAVRAVPLEARAQMAEALLPDLRRRRWAMPAAAARYYQVLQAEATIVGTDAAERFVVQAAGPGQVRLQVWARRPARPDSLLGTQRYTVRHTRRLSIYGLGGNDLFELRGALAPGFAVWLDGGGGSNQFTQPAPAQQLGVGLTVFASSRDHLRVSPAVQVRPASVFTDAVAWISRQYRLGLGNRPTSSTDWHGAPPADTDS
jgi:hypothetical protein